MRNQTRDQILMLWMKYCVILSKSPDLSELQRSAAWVPEMIPVRVLEC